MKSEKWALITGATSGIGLAVARQMSFEGYSLILIARRHERLAELHDELHSHHPHQRVEVWPLDVRDLKALEDRFSKASDLLAKVDVVVNNAGLARGVDPLYKGDTTDWDEVLDTNIKGVLWITRLVVPHMIAKNSGHIVNIGSVAGRWVYPNGAVYCASKFAVRALSEGLRMDLLGKKIRVTNVEPGMVETEFSEVRLKDKEKAQKVYKGMTPLSAEDIAETVSWVLLRPPHVNIAEIVVYPTDQASVTMVHRE